MSWGCLFLFVLSSAGAIAQESPQAANRTSRRFELLDGDRVAFVGDTLIERAQVSDCLETALTIRWPDRHVIFRNLGWSGDDVTGEARAGFGTADDGYKQLQQQIADFKPTVIFLGYGANASFGGVQKLREFVSRYDQLLTSLSASRAEIILLSPIRHENLGPPLPDPATLNVNRRAYTEAIRALSSERGCRFVDLYHYLTQEAVESKLPLTENGIHLSPAGYWHLARVLEKQLELPEFRWAVELQQGGVFDVRTAAEKAVPLTLTLTELQLPRPRLAGVDANCGTLRVQGLLTGNYELKIDRKVVAFGSAADWERGLKIDAGPMFDQVEKLRQTIREKNQLFFHRWRPQNETYLFGFRKHEQGQNAKEIPMFDPLIEAREQEIAKLRKPLPHTWELIRKPD